MGDGGNADQAVYKFVYQLDSDDSKLIKMTLRGKCTDYRQLDLFEPAAEPTPGQ